MTNEPLIVSFEKADPTQVDRLGAKGAKLVEDFRHVPEMFPGMEDTISVPDGFIISTDAWRLFHKGGDRLNDELFARILLDLSSLERRVGKQYGACTGRMPLAVAVRGGAPISLPGALGTVLNVGLNDELVAHLIEAGMDESFVLTTYLTAIRMYGEVVLDIPYEPFYAALRRYHVGDEGTIPVPVLHSLLIEFKGILDRHSHPRFPSGFEQRPDYQLRYCIEGVLASWMSPTAVEARRSRRGQTGGISDDMGTAVIIQEMVFGNRNDHSCLSGVLFTRDPRTGSDNFLIEWAPKVQCDKIVSGKLRKQLLHADDLQKRFPDVHRLLSLARDRFETWARRPLDIEFTVEDNHLFLLQRRPLRMTSNATVRAMWDLVDEGKTTIQLASLIINKALEQPEKVLKSGFHDYVVLAVGEPITDSADSGILTVGTEAALELAQQGREVILLRRNPYGESDVAVNHPNVRGVIRCDGNATGHEAVSAVAYSKPYLINMADASGCPLICGDGEERMLNPDSLLARYVGKRVFVDGEHGILGYTEHTDFLEDRKSRKRLYVDWEYLQERFDDGRYDQLSYEELLDLHYHWELELDQYLQLEKSLRDGDPSIPTEALLQAFTLYLACIPEKKRDRVLHLKGVKVEDFVFEPSVRYLGNHLGQEVRKILRALMLCTTWRTHWLHEIMVRLARERGETENDVIRDIFLKNQTMSLVRDFEEEGFHLMKVSRYYHLILASNFEYGQDLDKVLVGPGAMNFAEKEFLARHFLDFLNEVNPELRSRVRMVSGEPPLGQGHARIISIGLAIVHEDFGLVCRYLRSFLDQRKQGMLARLPTRIPVSEFVELYHLDPFFAPFPDLRISREASNQLPTGDGLLTFGSCSFGEYEGSFYGKEDYDRLGAEVRRFERYLRKSGRTLEVRPWHFEVDPYRRHSVIAAVGIRFDLEELDVLMESLKGFLVPSTEKPAPGTLEVQGLRPENRV